MVRIDEGIKIGPMKDHSLAPGGSISCLWVLKSPSKLGK